MNLGSSMFAYCVYQKKNSAKREFSGELLLEICRDIQEAIPVWAADSLSNGTIAYYHNSTESSSKLVLLVYTQSG